MTDRVYLTRLADRRAPSQPIRSFFCSFWRLKLTSNAHPIRDRVRCVGEYPTELNRLGRFGEVSALRTLSRYPVGRHYRGLAAAAWAAVILGGDWLGSSSLRRSRSSVSSGSGWVVRVSEAVHDRPARDALVLDDAPVAMPLAVLVAKSYGAKTWWRRIVHRSRHEKIPLVGTTAVFRRFSRSPDTQYLLAGSGNPKIAKSHVESAKFG